MVCTHSSQAVRSNDDKHQVARRGVAAPKQTSARRFQGIISMLNKNSTQRIQAMYDHVSGVKEAVGTKPPEPEGPEDSEGEQGKAQGKTQSKTGAQLNYAGFWKRFSAAFIDWLIFNISALILVLINPALVEDADAELWFNIAGILMMWIYFAAFESSSKQATPGKMALGIKVTDLNGRRIGFGKAAGRYFGRFFSMVILFIGCIMIAFTEKKQGLHDKMAGCLVVNK